MKKQTSIQQKIETYRQSPQTSGREYSVAAWHCMIAFGVCTQGDSIPYRDTHWDYYGNCWINDHAANERLVALLKSGVEIDYAASTDPASMATKEYGFKDTFTSSSYVTDALWGHLVLKDGSTFTMGAICPDGSFTNILKALGMDLSLEEAVEHLEHRMSQSSYEFGSLPSL